MTSTRLPGKVLADLAGKPLLERMISRLRQSVRLANIVVATTTNKTDDPVVDCAKRLGVEVFRGDETDVLGRIHSAAKSVHADPIVRLTADCPMADPAIIDAALDLFIQSGADYVSNCNRRTFPDGFDVEVISAVALDVADREARSPVLREHVTPYIRGNRSDLGCGTFRRADLIGPAELGHIRLTVDTNEDLEFVRFLFERLPDDFGWRDAVDLAMQNPMRLRTTQPPSKLEGLVLRPVDRGDARILFRWFKEPDRQATSIKAHADVTWTQHVEWLERRLADPNAWFAVAIYDGLTAGYVRVDPEAKGPVISIYVDAMFRGRAVGHFLIDAARKLAAARWPDIPLVAYVRKDNSRSAAFFRTVGFGAAENEVDGVMAFRDIEHGSPHNG